MHKIKVFNYHYPEENDLLVPYQYYRVHLGNSCVKYFTSKRQAEYFLGELNQFLNRSMYDLNFILADVYRLYRRSWPYMTKGMKSDRRSSRESCQKDINDTEQILDRLPRRASHPGNGSYWVFSDMNVAIDSMNSVLEIMKELHRDRSNFVELSEIESMERRLHVLQEHLDNFGYEKEEENRPPRYGVNPRSPNP